MRISPILLAIALYLCCFENVDGQRKRNKRRRRVNFVERRVRLGKNLDGSIEFPRELQYRMDVEGEASQELNLVLNPFVQMPKEKTRKKRKFAFYTEASTGEAFACKVKRRRGQINCQLSGILERNAETCFLSPSSNMADCESESDVTQGVLEVVGENNQPVTESSFVSNDKSRIDISRKGRSIFPEPGFKTVEVTFVADAAFMQPFYDRNQDDNAAEEEAELFATLLANEMSIFYRSVKDVSSGQLDLVLYPVAFVHPGKNNNFAWSQNNIVSNTILNTSMGLPDFANFVYNSLSGDAFIADHVMGLSGLDLLSTTSGTGLLGVAYVSTVCRPFSAKVSLQENRGTNLGWIAAHELGHALGAFHDQSIACPTRTNVMSSVIFNPSASTQTTYSKFSSCSVDYFTSHLSRYPDCLSTGGSTDEQFRVSFCQGFLGSVDISLDRQCQVRTGSSTASACVSTVSTSACYLGFQVSCRSSPTSSCSSTLRFVWNGTPCGSAGNVCFGGFCVPEFDICEVNSTTTPAPTTAAPTTVAPTTAAPTTVAPTTAAPTTVAPTTAAPTTVAPTTAAPTTVAPTTAAPTTVAPTSAAPTTVAPTTAAPTTVAPTTAAPTTVAPTTAAPTTVAPTTAATTTVAPTTVGPTTVTPTTAAPTTVAHTTPVQTTVAPTTAAPTTVAPTTVAPTTVAPTTVAPTTVAPTTVAPTTVAPTTAAPTTVAPTTAVPTTVTPTTAAPTTVAPTTAAPTTVAPTTAAPTTVAPTTAAPTTVAPTTAAPTTVAPTTAAPTTVAPTTSAPTTVAPTTVGPTTVAPTTAASTTVAPTTPVPTTVAPTTAAPTTVAPTTAAPTTVAPTTAVPTTVAPTTAAPTTVAPTTIAPTTVAPTTAAPTTVAPTTAAPSTVAPTTVAPTVTPSSMAPPTLTPEGRTSTATTPLGNTISTPTTEDPSCSCCGINRRRRRQRCCRRGSNNGLLCDCCVPIVITTTPEPECTCCGLSRRGRRRCCRRASNRGDQCDCCPRPRFLGEPESIEDEETDD